VFIIGTFLAVASIKGSDPWIVFPMLLLSWVASIWLIIILRSPLGLRLFGELLFTGVLVWVGVRVWPKPLPTPVLLTALYIGCEWDHIPITIEPGSSINVMWLSPVLLKGNPAIPFVGPFDTIRIPVGGKKLAWPAKSEGRMMTHAEMQENIKAKIMPTPYAFRCTLNNYAVTLDEIAAPLIIDTSDGKRHTYNIQFSPSVLGHPFEFYMVNKCSSGVVPTMVQWGNAALARIIGDAVIRRIPLQFERKAWPSNLIPLLGASWFIWNDTKDGCKWD